MTTTTAATIASQTQAATSSDAQLVIASRHGDRGAFGQIVRRYQAMVSGVIYSWCGDLHRSEDLAQDAFISAWKSLSGLREPARLGAWLCQIARRRVTDDHRGIARERLRLERIIPPQAASSAEEPVADMISAEERELLWRTLSQVAEPYRETMILYYRQGRSTADVAAVMEVSEDLVRQRLARGRQMLKDQVTDVVERGLARSAPGPQFASAVMTMLPGLGSKTLAASVAGKAAAGGAKGIAGLFSACAMWVGPVMGLVGGIHGSWTSVRQASAGAERRIVLRGVIMLWTLVIVGTAAIASLGPIMHQYHFSGTTFIVVLSLAWAVYGAAVVALVSVYRRRQLAIRLAAGISAQPACPAASVTQTRKSGKLMVVVAVVAAMTWMLGLAVNAGDSRGAWIVASAMAVMIVGGHAYVARRPATSPRALMLTFAALTGAVTIVMLNWRMYEWFAALAEVPTDTLHQRLPRWTVNLLICVLIAVVMGMTAASTSHSKSSAVDPAPERS
jgi:RNA polymerase sigma factor (sigma-70 family)